MRTLDRDVEQVLANFNKPTAPKKTILQKAAINFSRMAMLQAEAANLRSILSAVVVALYEETESGVKVNLSANGCIKPAPWGSRGHKHWNIRRIDAEAIRGCLMKEQGRQTLFLWDELARAWYLNIHDYPSWRAADDWVKSLSLSADRVLQLKDFLKTKKQ